MTRLYSTWMLLGAVASAALIGPVSPRIAAAETGAPAPMVIEAAKPPGPDVGCCG